MKDTIQKELAQIEQTQNVRILLAVESGSRAWGFASPDSDYDVRFIYVRPKDAYLRLQKHRDVIELPINDALDINGWDLTKTLRLLHMAAVPPYLPRHSTHVSPDQPSDLSIAQPIHIIFPYTTALFYGKMMIVHTVPSGGLVVW